MDGVIPDDAPAPRLCHLRKRKDFNGYGFNLHADKGKSGQYIGKVDDGSPAFLAGLREGDRIIEVNGTNIGSENHQQVVQRIKAVPDETKFLVVDEETDSYYKELNVVISSEMPNVKTFKTPLDDETTGASDEPLDPRYQVRLCHLKLWSNFSGYGFNLHADKGKSTQYIGKVDPNSPAEVSGLKENDRLVEVNGINVQSDSHGDVVKKIKSDPNQVKLLVVDDEADQYFRGRNIQISSSMDNVTKIICPDNNPGIETTSAPEIEAVPEVTSTTEEQSHPHSLRECHLKSWHDGKGYGFNMQAEKNKPGQFIAKVDSGSPADLAGLRAGDRLVEVNRDSVATDTHRQVVDRIKSNPDETILLVVDAEADSYFNSKGITLSSSLPFVEKIVCPDSNPDAGVAETVNNVAPDENVESTVNGISAESETNHEVEDSFQNGYYSTVQDSHEEPEYENPSNSFQTKPISYADLYENKDQENKVDVGLYSEVSKTKTEEVKPEKSSLTLNISSTADSSKTFGSPTTSVGSSKSPQVESPKSPVVIGGIEFAESAEAAKMKILSKGSKKKNTDTSRMSIQAKYELFKKL